MKTQTLRFRFRFNPGLTPDEIKLVVFKTVKQQTEFADPLSFNLDQIWEENKHWLLKQSGSFQIEVKLKSN